MLTANRRPARATAVLALLVLVAFFLVLFGQGLFLDRRTILWDTRDQFFPYLAFGSELWRSGIPPLWNPYLYAGYPAFADPQYQTFYPVHLLLSQFVVMTPKAVYLRIGLHYLLSGFFLYLLSSLFLKSLPARLTASLVWMANGFMISHFQHLPMIDTVAWLPLVLYLFERSDRERSLPCALGAGMALGLAILAGHPQSFTYMFYALGFWALLAALDKAGGSRRFRFRPFLLLVLVCTIAVLVGAVQLLPTYEFTALSNRAGKLDPLLATDVGSISMQISPERLITLVLPDFYGAIDGDYVGAGDISQSLAYFGCLPLFLAFSAILVHRDRHSITCFAGACLAMMVSMGRYAPLFRPLFDYAPGFGAFRAPAHFLFVFMLFAALLAGRGLDVLLAEDGGRKRNVLLVLGVLGITLGGVAMLVLQPGTAPVERLLENARQGLAFLALSSAAFLLLLDRRTKRALSRPVAGALAVLAVFLDLGFHGNRARTMGDRLPHAAYAAEPDLLRILRERAEAGAEPPAAGRGLVGPVPQQALFRIDVDSSASAAGPHDPYRLGVVGFNRALLSGAFLADGYNPLVLQRYVELSSTLKALDPDRFLALLNVRYVLSTVGAGTRIREVPRFLPRAFFVQKPVWAKDPLSARVLVVSPFHDVYSAVVLEDEGHTVPEAVRSLQALPRRQAIPVEIQEYRPGEVTLRVAAESPGFVVLGDCHYPGWTAAIDGKATHIYRANGLFRAVYTDPGEHEIRFRFAPRSLERGLFVTGTAFLLWAAALAGALLVQRSHRRRQKTSASGSQAVAGTPA